MDRLERRTKTVAAIGVLRALGGVRNAPEGLDEARVLLERARVVRVGVGDGGGRGGARRARRLVALGDGDADRDADCDEDDERRERAEDLYRRVSEGARNGTEGGNATRSPPPDGETRPASYARRHGGRAAAREGEAMRCAV